MPIPTSLNSENALSLSGVLVTILVGGLGAYTVQGEPQFLAVVGLAATQVICFLTYLGTKSRERTLQVLLFSIEAACLLALFFLVPSSFIAILSVVWIVQATDLFGPRLTTVLWLFCLGAYGLAQFRHFGFDESVQVSFSIMLYGLLQVFAMSTVQRSNRERKQREATAALNRELIATRNVLSQSVAQSERLRIARDLHDILGHHMTALILNLEVATHSSEGQTRDKVEQSLALAKLLLGELRSAVSELREESPIDLETSINKLVADIPEFDFAVDFSEAPRIDDVELAETFLRCAQEAITNVLRHSSARQCRIKVLAKGDECILSVSDDGQGSAEIEPGNGLKGMAERVKAQGGDLSWFHNEQGFNLQVSLHKAVLSQ